MNVNINKLKGIIYNCYSKDTAYDKVREDWTIENRTLGQCAVTALIFNDYFGGTINKCSADGSSHYFNELDEVIYDLTKEQFNIQIKYDDRVVKTRDEILNSGDTNERYKELVMP